VVDIVTFKYGAHLVLDHQKAQKNQYNPIC